MSKDWSPVTLGEIALIQNGSTPLKSRKDYWESGSVPWFTIEDLRQQGFEIKHTQKSITQLALSETSVSLIAEDSILICCTASVGAVAINRIPLTTNQQFNGLTIKDPTKVDLKFLFYWFLTQEQYLQSLGRSTTISYVSMAKLKAMELVLPPLDEQKRIVAKLDETLADLDKVTANAKGSLEEIDALWSSYLSEVFYSTSNSTDKPTESTWNSEKLQNVCAFFNDGNWIESKDQSDEGYRLIQTGNIGEGIYKSNDHRARYVSKETFEKLKCTEVFPGDVLISRLPDPIGRACRVPEMLEPCITGVDCTILRFKDDVIPEIFVYFSQTSNYLDAVNKMAGGTTRQRISRKNLGEIEFPVPPIEDQKQIITRLNAQQKVLEEMRNVKRKTLRDSEQLRSSILAAAFAGDF